MSVGVLNYLCIVLVLFVKDNTSCIKMVAIGIDDISWKIFKILTLLQLVCFCFDLEGTYVNLLIWWFEDNWLLRLRDIVIQMKFDVIMDLLNGAY